MRRRDIRVSYCHVKDILVKYPFFKMQDIVSLFIVIIYIAMRQSCFAQFFHCSFVISRTKEWSLTYRVRSSDLGQSVLCVPII